VVRRFVVLDGSFGRGYLLACEGGEQVDEGAFGDDGREVFGLELAGHVNAMSQKRL
jgi:hypothetical protein